MSYIERAVGQFLKILESVIALEVGHVEHFPLLHFVHFSASDPGKDSRAFSASCYQPNFTLNCRRRKI